MDAKGPTFFTTGLLFPDGQAVDLARNHRLIYWDGEHEDVKEEVRIGSSNFRAADIDPSLERVLRIPIAAANSNTEELVRELSELNTELGLDSAHSLLMAVGTLGTWVPECLPGGAPVLNFWGFAGGEGAVAQVMSAITRRPLVLVEASATKLAALSAEVYPTIIMLRPKSHLLAKLMNVAGSAQVIRAGSVVTVRYSVVAFTEHPLVGALNIPVAPATARLVRLLEGEVEELAARFQPRLLAYRLRQHVTVAQSSCPVEEFAPELKALARALTATVQCSPELQSRVLDALRPLDEQAKVASSASPAAVVIEALLVMCRENRPKAFILDVSDLANGILLGRHELGTLTPKAAGRIVHTLGLVTKREGAGYAIVLDSATRERIRQLARAYGVLFENKVHKAHEVHQ